MKQKGGRLKRHAYMLAVLLMAALAGCAGNANGTDAPSAAVNADENEARLTAPQAAASSAAPGDYTLDEIVQAAEFHLKADDFADIPQEELRQSFPALYATGAEVRGRGNGPILYIVLKNAGKEKLEQTPADREAKTYADDNNCRYGVRLDGHYGVLAFVPAETPGLQAGDVADAVFRSYTGEYILELARQKTAG